MLVLEILGSIVAVAFLVVLLRAIVLDHEAQQTIAAILAVLAVLAVAGFAVWGPVSIVNRYFIKKKPAPAPTAEAVPASPTVPVDVAIKCWEACATGKTKP